LKLWIIEQEIRNLIRRRVKGEYRAGEILDLTFKKIKRYAKQEIIFPKYALSLIADDSDDHCTRQGFMRYDSVILINLGGRVWAIGKGKAWGDYPARPYDNDILVLALGEDDSLKNESNQKIAETIMELISSYLWSSSFQNSIIIAKNSGCLFGGRKLGRIMDQLISSKIPSFVKKRPEVREGYVTVEVGGIFPALKSSIKYKKQLASLLSQTIIQILSDPSKYQ